MGALTARMHSSACACVPTDHVCLRRLLVLGVAPDHPALQPPLRVAAVKFRSHDGKNLLNTCVSGKKKAGAVFLSERDMVCTVEVSDGSSFTMCATAERERGQGEGVDEPGKGCQGTQLFLIQNPGSEE